MLSFRAFVWFWHALFEIARRVVLSQVYVIILSSPYLGRLPTSVEIYLKT